MRSLRSVRAPAVSLVLAVGIGACSSDVAEPSPTDGMANATSSIEPTANEPTPSPAPSAPARPIPSTPASEQSPAEGWVEVASFGSADTIETVHDVAAAPFGLLAAGVHLSTRSLAVFDPLAAESRIWLSDDARSWKDVTPPDTFADASIDRLVVLPDGAVLAFGRTSRLVDGIPWEEPAAWETLDGRTWTELEITVGDERVIELVAGGPGYLARVGADLGGQQLGFSSDGKTFAPVADPTGARIMTGIAAGPEGFVIRAEVYESADPATLYASGNGVDWYEASDPGWTLGSAAPIGPDWVALDHRPFDAPDDVEVRTWVSANGLDWTEAGQLPLRTVDLGDGAVCSEYPDLVSTRTLVVASTVLSYPCGEGLVQRFGTAHVSNDGGTWLALPFAAGVEIADPTTRGTQVSAGLDLESGTLLVGETGYRATFWFRPNQ
ncbi:MAG: hypothetical protein M3406_03990, partial [Chloroflexota bacterium]|nr:hypothetical protein [Chloroflexota bacterium]